ncbi:hypothetical protein V2G26_010931 [Clonostachys chloroleuca]
MGSTEREKESSDRVSVVGCQSQLEGKSEARELDGMHLKKRFSLMSMIAFGFTTMNSWVAFASGLAVPLVCGGGPVLIYGLLVSGVVTCVIAAGFAELASAFTSAGGQYHIVFMVFPQKTRHVAAFFTGWVSVVFIMAATASCSFFVCELVLNLITLWIESYVMEAWHVYLLHVLLCGVAFVSASRFPDAIGRIGIVALWLSIAGFIASLATLLAISETKQSSTAVFTNFQNVSGWGDGWAAVIGIASCLWAYCGMDAPTHISEEVPNPSRNVPIAIGVTLGLGIVTVVAWNISLLFVVPDILALIESGIPILGVYEVALNSRVATTIWAVYYIVLFYNIVLNLFIFSGRMIWSLSRDGGIPYSSYFSHLRWASPLRATAIMLVLQILVGLLYIASKTAYSSFVGLTLFALNITLILPQAALLFGGRESLPRRAFSLGRFGYAINALATLFGVFFNIVLAFPISYPITGTSMNYLIVVFAIGLIVTIFAWFSSVGKRFTGPQLNE